MILLAIDTATECCSAALWIDGKLTHRSTIQPRLHAELILPFVDVLLTDANISKSELQGIVVGQGPGAFTGVRIGVAVAQGLALALDIPVVPVSNLQTLAFSAYKKLNTNEKKIILVATDARMNEVYWAKYLCQYKNIQLLSDEKVGAASTVDLLDICAYIGSGFSVYPELELFAKNQQIPYETNIYSSAKDMLLMVNEDFSQLAVSIEDIEPVYLRQP